ncbi:MAG: hypothetical protein ACYC0X_26655 [Pirellulaceae bacterium]
MCDEGSLPERDTEFVLSGCLTVNDAIQAHRLATRGFWPRATLAILIVAVFVIILFAVAVSSRPYSPEASNVMLLVACVILPAILIIRYAVGRLRLHRFARTGYGMFAPTHSTFSPTKILTTSDGAKAEFDWSVFSHYVSNEAVALVYFKNSKQHLIVARTKLDDPNRWDDFVSMIRSQFAAE